jgi:hypothetical protein
MLYSLPIGKKNRIFLQLLYDCFDVFCTTISLFYIILFSILFTHYGISFPEIFTR